ncbi:glycosyltransferase family 2 protein [Infirmifilum uzonense]|uniref:glycosyltransferase family 2 protein n=1 Tax=Infirmifilum uzonense TaxID=1550241 RepID=UPI000A77374E|nr:cellulose synthase catalytic subunit [Infirmifilum uzonense]
MSVKLLKVAFFALPFLSAALLTWFTLSSLIFIWLNYAIWLTTVTGFLVFLQYFVVYLRSFRYSPRFIGGPTSLRIAVFVTSFNEDPKIIKETLLSAKAALRGRGDVYLLDDSTNQMIVEELKKFCEEHGIIYVHRKERRGFKAGAINNALKLFGDKYDLFVIFDADQKPRLDFLDQVLPYFEDPQVAFVQVPQRYTELRSPIAYGAKFQQEPFLRRIMRGRSLISAFSLGSGTVFRVKAVKEAGYFDENSITEDAEISVRIHSKGWKSVYHDEELIWYGEPPQDAAAYIQQQNRWAFGYFKLTPKIIRSDLSFAAFFDYIAGFLYWLKEGPLTFFEILAPIVFLLLKQPFIRMDPYLYALAYFPYMFISVTVFVLSMRGFEYGFKGFLAHQANEYLAFTGITAAFISFLLGRRIPFKVTPKGKSMRNLRVLVIHLVLLVLLLLSIVSGLYWYYTSSNPSEVAAIIINLFWAFWHLFFLSLAIYNGAKTPGEEKPTVFFEKLDYRVNR